MGDVIRLEGTALHVRLRGRGGMPNRLVIRDAVISKGILHTAKHPKSLEADANVPSELISCAVPKTAITLAKVDEGESSLVSRVGPVNITLVNGVMGDPLLHVQLRYCRRSLLFDLGDAGRLSARTAHQVSDVFITHTHADHIGGFMWLLRSRIGHFPPCRFYGPPGLADHVAGMVRGILWDRVEDRAPQFEIRELHGDLLHRCLVTAGSDDRVCLESLPVVQGVLWREPSFCVRCTALDHGTRVLAYAFEPVMQIKVRRDKLVALGLKAGHWLQELKQHYLQGELNTEIALPDGSHRSVEALAETLIVQAPGEKLVYATDFGDTENNRHQLIGLARGAHTFFCEATFLNADSERAENTHHLTTRACGEIAKAARVKYLLPFHFSRRYEKNIKRVYEELHEACSHTVVPRHYDVSQASMEALFH